MSQQTPVVELGQYIGSYPGCRVCTYHMTSPKITNWIARLQDFIEDKGITLEKFVEGSHGVFFLERGRLRLQEMRCINIGEISNFVEKAMS